MTLPDLGIVEGYFGTPWSWAARTETMLALAPHGYRFFHYAPKGDPWLRRRWTEPYPDAELERLTAFGRACRSAGVRFGVGLSPFEAHRGFDLAMRDALKAKIDQLNSAGIDEIGILFDDMEGAELVDLADRQRAIVDVAAARTRARRIIVCPSYYSDDPILDRVFGRRPPDYLAGIARLDPAIDLYWTGEEVYSREFTPGGLARVAEMLGRKPLLWDNYPVSDGHRQCRQLNLRGFTGRNASIAGSIAGHAVNPALQPVLTRIPLLTLVDSYAQGDAYRYGAAFAKAVRAVAGDQLGAMIEADLLRFQDTGLDRLGDVSDTRARYSTFDHPAAREIVAWLDGEYAVSVELVKTQ